jgi:hypothetical protein
VLPHGHALEPKHSPWARALIMRDSALW